MTKKTEATKAPAQRTDAAGSHTDEAATKLAHVDPAHVTEAQIKDIAADNGSDTDPENSANKDAADHLRNSKADAKAHADATKRGETPERGYYHGQGGGAGGPG